MHQSLFHNSYTLKHFRIKEFCNFPLYLKMACCGQPKTCINCGRQQQTLRLYIGTINAAHGLLADLYYFLSRNLRPTLRRSGVLLMFSLPRSLKKRPNHRSLFRAEKTSKKIGEKKSLFSRVKKSRRLKLGYNQ